MLNVRLAIAEDIVDVFEWRNDSQARKMFHSSDIVNWDRHSAWYRKTLENDARCLLMCVDDNGIKVGVVRFDIENNTAVV